MKNQNIREMLIVLLMIVMTFMAINVDKFSNLTKYCEML